MTKFEREVLARFAAMTLAASKWEVFGHTPITKAGDVNAALHALVGAGLLAPLPYAETCDEHGGTRFRVPTRAYAVLGLPTRYQASPAKPRNLRTARAFVLPDFTPAPVVAREEYRRAVAVPGRN